MVCHDVKYQHHEHATARSEVVTPVQKYIPQIPACHSIKKGVVKYLTKSWKGKRVVLKASTLGRLE